MGILTLAIPLWLGATYGWYKFSEASARKELAADPYMHDYIKQAFIAKNIIGPIVLFFLSLAVIAAWQVFALLAFIAAVVVGVVAALLNRWNKSIKTDKKDV